MELIDQKVVKRFIKLYKKKKTEMEKMELLKEKYKTEGYSFHKVFLHSGIIYNLNSIMIDELVKFINQSKIVLFREIEEDLLFIRYVLRQDSLYAEEINERLTGNYKNICIEDFFNYMDYVEWQHFF